MELVSAEIFYLKLGQMLHGQILTVQMSPRQLTTHTDDLTIQPSKFG